MQYLLNKNETETQPENVSQTSENNPEIIVFPYSFVSLRLSTFLNAHHFGCVIIYCVSMIYQ
ncbi:hypothetical protein PORCRE_1592 [Porphyromonas crevioricanis JCM 15906]|uniref:Uncharacterized protein n=1 Tax=Porphyromonas crevioricanis JCM 15906 TaxID=1305617 RepID=T1CS05_9PORP|nr:hypothetical protein PORCRE_1592 [Porphyromonas crevioricanis JCM 15906]GAD07967.1 hypothetical protein PORCAN_1597 [Porphyromonas crevioricanis JCM 13913]